MDKEVTCTCILKLWYQSTYNVDFYKRTSSLHFAGLQLLNLLLNLLVGFCFQPIHVNAS